MPNQMTVEQFGASVKAKYPQYQNLPDAELGSKVLEKYPQYNRVIASSTSTPTPAVDEPKKEGFLSSITKPVKETLAAGVGAVEGAARLGIGALTGGGLSQEEINKANEAVTRERSFGIFGTAKPAGSEIPVGDQIDPNGGQIKNAVDFTKGIVGRGAEIASYAAPVGVARGIGTAAKTVSTLGRVGAGAGFGALGGGLAAGGRELANPDSTVGSVVKQGALGALGGAVIGGALPAIGAGAGKVLGATKNITKPLTEATGGALQEARSVAAPQALASRAVNSIIKPLEKEFRFGRDPGQAVVDEGIVANTVEGLSKKITETKKKIGAEIEAVLTSPTASAKKIDIRPAIKSIDSAIAKADKSGDEALANRLQAIKDGLEYTYTRKGGKLRKSDVRPYIVSPKEAQLVKREVGEAMRWTGEAFENDINQARAGIYRQLNDAINAAVPEVGQLNDRYGGILSAEKSIQRTENIAQRRQAISFGDIGLAGFGGATFGGPGAVAAVVLRRIVESTAFKTRIAQILNKIGTAEEVLPVLIQASEKERNSILQPLPIIERMKVKSLLKEADKAVQGLLRQGTLETSNS